MLILGTRKISVFWKKCIGNYYIEISKNHISAKFLHTLYTVKSVYIEFLEVIKNCVSAKFLHTLYTIKSVYIEFLEVIENCVTAKSMLKEAVYNKALLYTISLFILGLQSYYYHRIHFQYINLYVENFIQNRKNELLRKLKNPFYFSSLYCNFKIHFIPLKSLRSSRRWHKFGQRHLLQIALDTTVFFV